MNTQVVNNKPEAHFNFGKNWKHFSKFINESRLISAEKSLTTMLAVDNLQGLTFLDAGCGSSLFSLAAMRLGAKQVHSFDYDEKVF